MLHQRSAYVIVFNIGITSLHTTRLPSSFYVSPSVQLNIKLLAVSKWRGLPCAIFICLEKQCVSLGDQAVNIDEYVYISCQMLFIWFFLRHKMDLETDIPAAGPTGALEVEGVRWGFLSFPVRSHWTDATSEIYPPHWEREERIFFFLITYLQRIREQDSRKEEKKNVCVP